MGGFLKKLSLGIIVGSAVFVGTWIALLLLVTLGLYLGGN